MQFVPHPERFAERYLYLPLLGLVVAFASIAERGARWRAGGLAAAALILLCAGRSMLRNQDWKDDRTLWESAVKVNPDCARAQFALGLALNDREAWSEAVERFDGAIAVLGGAPALAPLERGRLLQARAFRAQALAAQGDALRGRMANYLEGDPERASLGADARRLYRRAAEDYEALLRDRDVDGTPIADDPRQATTYKNAAAVHFRLEEYGRAEELYRRQLSLVPGTPIALEARFWLGMILLAQGT